MDKKQEKLESVAKKFLVAPKFDLVGPDVEDDINRAITRYGKEAVLKAVKRLTSKARGRPTEKDWVLLENVLIEDAKVWLTGGDPFTTRSNYSIAMDFAESNPGHNPVATAKRIQKKLRQKPYDRKFRTLIYVQQIGEDNYPHGAYIRALEELNKLCSDPRLEHRLRNAQSCIANYTLFFEKPPPEQLSMTQLRDDTVNEALEFIQPSDLLRLGPSYQKTHDPKS